MGRKLIWKNNGWKFPNLEKELDIQIQEAQRSLPEMNSKGPTPKHVIIKMSKVKNKRRSLNEEKKKNYLQGTPIRRSEDFSVETLQFHNINKYQIMLYTWN